jgi:hypothetical protein
LSDTLVAAANSGLYEPPAAGAEPEQTNLMQLGANLAALTIPPELVAGESIPLYGTAPDAFVVVTVHSTARLCGLTDGACRLAGMSPVEYFAQTRTDGSAAWLQAIGGATGVPLSRVIFVDIVTSEGEAPAAFQARCAGVPGFSRTLLDVLAPSATIYYGEFVTQASAHNMLAEKIDLCDALGDSGADLMNQVARDIAARIASH